jgi:hypothetical protein
MIPMANPYITLYSPYFSYLWQWTEDGDQRSENRGQKAEGEDPR